MLGVTFDAGLEGWISPKGHQTKMDQMHRYFTHFISTLQKTPGDRCFIYIWQMQKLRSTEIRLPKVIGLVRD